MSDIEIKLEPQDEFNHQPDEASNYNESMYFNVFDHCLLYTSPSPRDS